MNVILLAPTPPPAGGIAGWTLRMQKATLKNKWKVRVVDEKLIGDREVFGKKINRKLSTEIKRSLIIWKNLWQELNNVESKVVHSCIPAGTTGMMREYICAILTKLKGKKFIIHYRCTIPNMCKTRTGIFMFKLLSNQSDYVIALNSQSVEFVKEYSNTPVNLIPNFIEETAISKEKNRVISEKVKTILYVGGVIETKGCWDIVAAAKEFPEIEFRLVGKASAEIYELSLTPNITVCGEKNKDEVNEELHNADIFMFVTYFPGEGFSNALAEAMASGLPCIATDWAANVDMLENKGGVIVPVKDKSAMASAIKLLKDNKELRECQSNWNIHKVRTSYNDKLITEMYVDLYEKVLKDK